MDVPIGDADISLCAPIVSILIICFGFNYGIEFHFNIMTWYLVFGVTIYSLTNR